MSTPKKKPQPEKKPRPQQRTFDEQDAAMVPTAEDLVERCGKAHPLRGLNHVAAAKSFQKRFPIGSTLVSDDFDDWAQKAGYLVVPAGAARDSDAWIGHVKRRNTLLVRLNKAASHPRMPDPFWISVDRVGAWVVRNPPEEIMNRRIRKQIEQLFNSFLLTMKYLMQASDWSQEEPVHRLIAESKYDDVISIRELMISQAIRAEEKVLKFKGHLPKGRPRGRLEA